MPTYRSIVPITTQPREDEAYARAADLFSHARALGYRVTRLQYMPATQFIEVDTTSPLPVGQLAHFGLQGPV